MRINFDPPASGPEGAMSSSVWTPPACYYAPLRSPEEMKDYWDAVQEQSNSPIMTPEHSDSLRSSRERFLNEYPDYHLDLQGEGVFWGLVRNPDYPSDEQRACEPRTFWVDYGDPPPVEPGVVDVALLAELAWEETRLPDPVVRVNPAGTQKVGLPMWVWLDTAHGRLAPVSVRAELDNYGIWAETTATPKRLRLEAGTGEAAFHPATQVCEFGDGRIGEPYERGRSGEEPPCGITYQRATDDGGSYTLTATLTWEVTWRDDADASPRPLADGVVETTVEISVDEVQTIVR
jgi:enoyl reductase